MFNFIKKSKKNEEKQDYYVFVDFSKIKKMKFSRPNRRSNDCHISGFELSSRIINSVERL